MDNQYFENCLPESGDTVTGGIYSELIIPSDVQNVTLDGPTFLDKVTIEGTNVIGTIYVPTPKHFSTPAELGDNNINVVQLKVSDLVRRAEQR